MVMRKSWDEYFMDLAHMVKSRSTCARRKTGAILVRDKRIIATGYNGSPTGFDNCLTLDKCIRHKMNIKSATNVDLTRAVHAEANCIYSCAYAGVSAKGSLMYCTNFPCSGCLKALIQSGVVEVIYSQDYDDGFSKELIKESNLIIRKLEWKE
jgi:dCMP deaminase